MAQTGYSPIQLYYSTTASTAPAAGNLASGELAINITDGILFYKDNAGVVQTLATKAATSGSYTSITLTGGTANGIAYLNGSKVLTTGTSMTYNGTDTWTFDGGTSTYILGASGEMLIGEDTNRFYFAGGFGVSPAIPIVYGNAGTTYQSWIISSEQMRLTSTGLGIGTSSPGQLLEVSKSQNAETQIKAVNANTGSSARAGLVLGNNTSTAAFGVLLNGSATTDLGGANSVNIYQGLNAPIAFFTNATERMRLDSSGNLGIGTSSPGARLDSYTATTGVGGWSYNGQFTAPNYPLFRLGATTPNKYSSIGNNADGSFTFIVNGSSSAIGTEAMYLTAAGNLGLGVTPSAWYSDYRVAQIGLAGAVFNDNYNEDLNVSSNAYADTRGGYKFIRTGYAQRYKQTNSGQHQWLTSNASGTAGNAITFTQAMTLNASGNLGIGTSSPAAKLEVAGGTSSIAGLFKSSSGTATNLTLQQTGIRQYSLQLPASSNNFVIRDDSAAQDRIILDSSGNLGLGVTPSAWGSPFLAFQVGNKGAAISGRTDSQQLNLSSNWYYGGGTNTYIANGYATRYAQESGGHYWYNAASGTAGTAITFTQAMTLDASGNLALGTTAATFTAGYAGQHIHNSATSSGVQLHLTNAGTGATAADGSTLSVDANANLYLWNNEAAATVFGTNATERARIDSSGNLLVKKTAATTVSQIGVECASSGYFSTSMSASANTTTSLEVYSTGATAYRFYVGLGGTVYATSTTITAISDQRFKENIRDLDDGLSTVMALKPRKFDWKTGKGKDIKNDRGFIAQEFEQVLPDMVETWRDPAPEGEEPYKAVNPNLIPTLVKAIQEQQALIEQLTARVAQLEDK